MSTPIVGSDSIELDQRETIAITFDLTDWFDGEPVLAAGTPALVRKSDGTAFASGLAGPIEVSGAQVTQVVTALQPGERYWLILPVTAAGETFAPRASLECLRG